MVHVQLQTCPFCDAFAALGVMEIENGAGRIVEAYVRCDACEASGPVGDNVEEAQRLWNKAPRVRRPVTRPSEPIQEPT